MTQFCPNRRLRLSDTAALLNSMLYVDWPGSESLSIGEIKFYCRREEKEARDEFHSLVSEARFKALPDPAHQLCAVFE